MPSTFEDVINKNDLKLENTSVNKVIAFGQEVQMINIRNCTTSPWKRKIKICINLIAVDCDVGQVFVVNLKYYKYVQITLKLQTTLISFKVIISTNLTKHTF